MKFNNSGGLTDRYLWGPAVDQVLADEQLPGSSSTPSTAGQDYWMITDNLGTVRDVVTNNSLVEHFAYDAFGKVTGTSGSSFTEAIGYTGGYYDSALGLVYHSDPSTGIAGRWYDTATDRWLNPDQSGLGPDSNPYRYCGNGPTFAVDPSGNQAREAATGDLHWYSRITGDAQLSPAPKYSIPILQTLSGKSKTPWTAVDGTQEWQTNDVRTFILVYSGDKFRWLDPETTHKLDVNNIEKGTQTTVQFKDTLGVSDEIKVKGARIAALIQVVEKKAGLRPYHYDDNKKVQFDAESLPSGPNFEPTDDQWKLANTLQGPILHAETKYVYLDFDCLFRQALKVDQDLYAKLSTVVMGTTGEPIDKYEKYSTVAWFKYTDDVTKKEALHRPWARAWNRDAQNQLQPVVIK